MTENDTAPKLNGWNIYHRGKLIEQVFYIESCSAAYVKASMIDHDGMPADIEVRRLLIRPARVDALISSFARALRLYPWAASRERWADRNERLEELERMAAELVNLGAGDAALELWRTHAPEDVPVIGPLRFL